jgi:hypothetical protein
MLLFSACVVLSNDSCVRLVGSWSYHGVEDATLSYARARRYVKRSSALQFRGKSLLLEYQPSSSAGHMETGYKIRISSKKKICRFKIDKTQ